MENDAHVFYGATLDADALGRFLQHVFTTNLAREATGALPRPICIWGRHGIGKTALVEAAARSRGWGFAYIAPAQFEEMGDLNGLPVLEDGVTRFAPPAWVPTTPGPGILLLDDLNRADDRILRGLMQLLQRRELTSWALPEGWQIVATANPEGGDYGVTPMDDALITRMLHVTLRFDVLSWARWATQNGVDSRGINFVLTYPEAVTGHRTTARSLTAFFDQIAMIEDLRSARELVYALGCSALEEPTVASFLAFIEDGMVALPDPLQILDAAQPSDVTQLVDAIAGDPDAVRLDRLSTVCTRLFLFLTAPHTQTEARVQNLRAFLLSPALPNDLRALLHRDLLSNATPALREALNHPEIALRVLDAL